MVATWNSMPMYMFGIQGLLQTVVEWGGVRWSEWVLGVLVGDINKGRDCSIYHLYKDTERMNT